tara:strand:+ start:6993 stop:8873 length:1881 start_codon:yes stop_codon:yes gene_type:complete
LTQPEDALQYLKRTLFIIKMNKFLKKNLIKLITNKWFIFCVITCVALVMRIHNLDHESLFMDEIHQISYYKGTIPEVTIGAIRQQQPPLDYLIGAFFYKFSESDYMVRLPAALWGTGAVLLLMILSNSFASWPIAAFTGFIMALNPHHIYFSQEARPYSIPVFFLLAMLLSLKHLLTSNKIGAGSYLIFFTLCFGFLLTRSLSPLATYISLGIILFIKLTTDLVKNGLLEKTSFYQQQTRLIIVLFILLVSLLLYFPFFLKILHTGQRYLNTTQAHDLTYFISRLSEFSFDEILQAWTVQLEPFAILFSVLYGISLLFIFNKKNETEHILVRLLAALIPLAFFIHYAAFRIHTNSPFRPPYAIYLLPLILLLSSYSLEKIKLLLARHCQRNILKIASLIASIIIISTAIITLTDFKSIRKKSNWRGVGKYLSEQYSTESLIVFSTIEPAEHWQPIFYGFDRYYYGESQKVSMSQLKTVKNQLVQASLRPILLIFHYRDYLLTSHSRFTFHPGYRHSPFEWQTSKWPQDLDLKSFTGFSIVTLNEKNPEVLRANTADQIHYIIDGILTAAPQDSALVEHHLTASSLTPSEYTQHKFYHIEQAKKLARIDQSKLISEEENNQPETVIQ